MSERHQRRVFERRSAPLSIFEPELFLPTQLERGDWLHPEHLLMLAVLDDAIRCLFGRGLDLCTHRVSEQEAERSRARQWFASDDTSRLFSFRSVCDHLGFDAEAIREGLTTRGATRAILAYLTKHRVVPAKRPHKLCEAA